MLLPAALAAGCRSVETNLTAPSSNKCAVTLAYTGGVIPAGGTTASITVTTGRECSWSLAVQGGTGWFSASPAGGQGSGAVTFSAAPNDASAPRQVTVTIGDQSIVLTQAAAPCQYAIAPGTVAIDAAGGSVVVSVTARAGCTWTATSNVAWLQVTSGASGTGSGQIAIAIGANAGPARSGTLTVAGQTIVVNQAAAVSAGCSVSLTVSATSFGAGGGTGTLTITTQAGCPWTATTSESWITVMPPASGSGPAAATFAVAANTGPARSGAITVAGQVVIISQAAAAAQCTYTVAPTALSVDTAGGTASVGVTAAPGCAWRAVSRDGWITVTAGQSGTGAGTVELSVAANTTAGVRTGVVTVADQSVVVTQAGCTFSLVPSSVSVGAGGGPGSFVVNTPSGCAWTVASNATWITITGGSSGSGNGTVSFSVAANPGPARTGTITVAGQTFVVSQAGTGAACTYAVSPTTLSVAAAGGSVSVGVSSQSGCAWTALSNEPWIVIAGAASGTGDGAVSLTVQANAGGPRTGTLLVAGTVVTLNQAGACSYTLSPSSADVPASGQSGSIGVSAPTGCSWTALASDAWLQITGGADGTGAGTVSWTAAPNPAPAPRLATISVGDATTRASFRVTQAGLCTYDISPVRASVGAGSSAGSVTVSTQSGCAWTAVSNAAWIEITAGRSGNGPGTVGYSVAENPSPQARQGTLTVAGQTFTVDQAGITCTYVVTPTALSVGAAGGAHSVSVTAPAGCAWTASSGVPWITLTSAAAGNGNGTVTFNVQGNASGTARSGTLTVAGQTVTVNQGS